MSKKIMRLWSMLLVFVMIFNMLPLHAMAEELAANQNSSSAKERESESNRTLTEDVYVIEEITESRTEYIKEFRLSNGLHMASVYAYPVHYEVNGQWEEIDNTLQLSNTRSGNVYTNTAGIWEVSFPQNMTEKNGITITKDGYTLIFRMAGELHNSSTGNDRIAESEMVEIPIDAEEPIILDETVVLSEEVLPNEELNNSTDASQEEVAEEATDAESVLENAGTDEDNGLVVQETEPDQEIIDSQGNENLEAEDTEDETVILSVPADEVVAAVETIDINEIKKTAEYPETVVETLNSRLKYSNVYKNTDVFFDLNSNLVKESIVLKAYSDSLSGYAYVLEVGDMIPVLLETGGIELWDADGKHIVMYMPEPFLVDDAGVISHDIEASLEGSDGRYVLTYALPREWLADTERQWPVVLDPAVQPTLDTNNIRDRTVCSVGAHTNEHGSLLCGYHSSVGICRMYVKYTDLPTLTSADVIVSANMRMCMLDGNYNSSKSKPVVEVHKVNAVWESQTINWANKPSYDATVEDYAVTSANGYYNWDVTDLVREWYEGENTGMMFKMPDSVEAEANLFSQFYSSDYSYFQVSEKPTLTIIFRNNNGLEGYWDYTTSSAGRAGTGYVNQYTGNLVWIRDDIGFGGNRMPVTISHVYNTNDSTENLYGMGNGWRTNFNQRVYHWTDENAYGDYYVWEDSDGTDHYFLYESSGTYKDEDGLELTLTTNGTEADAKYCIMDKYGNASYFDTYGRLTKQSNNQKTQSSITLAYTTTSGRLISTITDGAGRVYTFTYNTNNLLSQIAYKGKVSSGANLENIPSITYVNFGYTNSNLASVTDKDGKTSNYTYTTNNLLETAQDIDGYMIRYAYTTTTAGQPNRIKTIAEYSGSTAGGVLNIEYAHNQTKFTDYNGNVQIVQFNNMGNTISIQDDQGRAQYAQYAINDPQKKDDTARAAAATAETSKAKGNQLLLASKLQNTVGNILKDSSFETGTLWNSTNTSYSSPAIDTTNAYLGNKSLKVTHGSGAVQAGAYSAYFTINPEETYTFSAYVKTGDSPAYLSIGGASRYLYSEQLPAHSEWTRLEVQYTNITNAPERVYAFVLSNGPGVTYLDCAQIEKAPTASRYNLIENGDFTYSGYAWSSSAGRTTVTSANKAPAPQLDTNVYRMTGNPSAQNRISQTVNVSGSKGDTFVLAGWAKGDSVPITDSREFALIATFKNGSTTVNTSTVRFNYCADSSIEWQYAASPIVAEEAFTSITIELAYDYNANSVYFDGVQLYKEEFGNSYTYDDNGNIISVKDVQSQTTSYEYTNNNLTKQILPSGAALTYTYDPHHNVKTATSDTGIVYAFEYDEYGNNIKVKIASGSVELTSSAKYSSDGNRLVSTTDAADKVTSYSYDENTNVLEWVQYPMDKDETKTKYTYDDMYRLASAAANVSTGSTLKAEYGYTNDLLTSITTGSTTYSFTYGAFALRSNIKIGSRTLASYTYTARNNFLDTLAYGNGDSVKYTYDKQGRVTKQTYEDGDTVTYKYDNSGALASVTDSATGITTTYYYDYSDRLLRYAEKGDSYSHIVGYEYDEINNLTALVETINGTEYKTTYGYDDDNRVTSVTNGSASESYTYDAYSRVSQKETKNGDTTVLTDTFGYRAPTDKTTSGQVATLKSAAAGYNVTYTYTYDDNGNILSVSDGSKTTSYVYDSANQLIRENNQAAGKTWVWTYDDGGNILSRKEYAYTTGTLGSVLDSVPYVYYSGTWGDLLTTYDGNAIVTDNIGNMISDSFWNYTWEHGRQLESMFSVRLVEAESSAAAAASAGVKNGLYADADGEIRYYVDGISIYAGLVYVDGYFYYINSSQKAVKSCTYRVSKNNGLLPIGDYTFDAHGRMTDAPSLAGQYELRTDIGYTYNSDGLRIGKTVRYGTYDTSVKQGLHVDSDGAIRYYVDGEAIYAGLVYWQGNYYYINSSKVAVKSSSYYVTKNNGLMASATYNFDANGRMTNPPSGASTDSVYSGTPVSSTVMEYGYVYNGSSLSQMTVRETVDNGTSTVQTLNFAYDASGMPMSVTYSGATYYYATNLQGDVTAILNASGTAVVKYTYDAWGKLLSTSGTMADTLGEINPLRYRGYVYDTETTLYYLQSRYYNPEMGRFINADDTANLGADDGLTSFNLFAYCANNPVNRFDDNGNWSLPNWAKVVIGVGIIAAAAVATVATGGAAAGVAGYVAAGVLKGALVGGAIGAAGGAVEGIITNRVKTGSWSGSGQAALDGAADGFMKGTLTGAVSGGLRRLGQVANAAKAWNGTSKFTPYQDMVRHYNKHVINEGQKALAKNIVKYTNDALAFYNGNSAAGRLLRTGVMKIAGTPGGIFTTTGKILSFWYC